MLETPAMHANRIGTSRPAMPDHNLTRFRYHTGALPTRLHADEVCPVLFRDIGFEGMLRFLKGDLSRLCGAVSPITYLRTANYCEPYSDFGRTGRLMLLRPLDVAPWHSGLPTIYIAPASVLIDTTSMVFVPPDLPLTKAENLYKEMESAEEFSEAMGRGLHADAMTDTRDRLEQLQQTFQAAELRAAPLRQMFQSPAQRKRDQAREQLHKIGLTESDLCTAWHHLSDTRRDLISAALLEVEGVLC